MKRELCWVIVALVAIALVVCGCNEEQRIWGQGDLPPGWVGFFGKDNTARLDFVQTREINQAGQVINQHHAIIYGLDIKDPNGPTVYKRGLIERVTTLESLADRIKALTARIEVLETEDPNFELVDWVGSPGVANWDGYFLNDGWLLDYRIGFRPDGVVMWKYIDPNE